MDENMNMTEMVNEQAVETTTPDTANGNLGTTIGTTVVIGLAGYGIGKLIERVVKWGKRKIAEHKAKATVVEAQPEEVTEVEVVD